MLLVERKIQVKNSAGGTQIWRVWTSSKNNQSLDISWWKLQGSSEVSEKREADTVGRKDRTHTVIWGREELARVNRDKVQEGGSTCCVLPQVLPVRGRWAISIPPWAEMEKFKVKEGTEGRPTSKSTAQAYSLRKIYSPLKMVPPTMVACQRMAPW